MDLMVRRLAIVLTVTWALLLSVSPVLAAQLLVDGTWLEAHLGDGNLRIVDMVSERQEYRRGHIPGAVDLSVEDVRVKVRDGGYRLPTAAEAARLFGDLGIGPDTHVVIYDDSDSLDAARLF